MKTVLLRMFIAGVLAAFAWLSWSESRLAARVADAKQDLATFNHENLDGLTPTRAVSGATGRAACPGMILLS